MNATISINRELKERAEMFFENYGISLSDVITNFIDRIIDNDNRYTGVVSRRESNVSAFGSLSKYANAELKEKENDAWEVYAREKYGTY